MRRAHYSRSFHAAGLDPADRQQVVAITSTKLPIWAGHGVWIFHMPKLARYGFWSMAHEARDDFLMLLGSIYLLIAGAGAWSLDAVLDRNRLQRRGS